MVCVKNLGLGYIPFFQTQLFFFCELTLLKKERHDLMKKIIDNCRIRTQEFSPKSWSKFLHILPWRSAIV